MATEVPEADKNGLRSSLKVRYSDSPTFIKKQVMSYNRKLQLRCRRATPEYIPATRILGRFTEQELADRQYVVDHLQRVGLPDMSSIVKAMPDNDYRAFVQDIEDTSEEDGFH